MKASLQPVPTKRLVSSDFVKACTEAPDDLIYFLVNVGDGDTQLILLPTGTGSRRMMVVDVATASKLPALVRALASAGVIPPVDQTKGEGPQVAGTQGERAFAIVVGTHPHGDHISGMPNFLQNFGDQVGEYWDCGYYHPIGAYVETMVALEDEKTQITHPTSGTTRFIDMVKITALSPGIGLRTRFDSFGTNINDASIALKIEYPAARISQEGKNRRYLGLRDPWAMILGADAQTTSWAQATVDFPELHSGDRKALYKELKQSMGLDPLKAQLFKVPHHGSKHGLNLELVERISPSWLFISSVGGGGKYNFPHNVTMENMREALEPTTTSAKAHSPDIELGIHATHAVDSDGKPLGSIAVSLSPKRGKGLRVWRFGDTPNDTINLGKAREYKVRSR